jgi:hypothetical protein
MKKNLFAIVLLSLSVCIAGAGKCAAADVEKAAEIIADSTVSASEGTSRVIFDGSPYNFVFSWKKKASDSHWTGIGFAFSDLRGGGSVDLDLTHSYSVVFNVGDYTLPLAPNWLMATGLGFDWSRYRLRGNQALQSVDGRTVFAVDQHGREYTKSRLLAYYATVPLLLEYQTKISGRRDFFLYAGVEGLVKLYSKSQAEVKTTKGVEKLNYKDLNLLPLNFRLMARCGFDDFSIFGYYQPLSMFKDGRGPDIHPLGIGLMVNF